MVAANSVVRFTGQRRQEVYEWVEKTLVRHQYNTLRKLARQKNSWVDSGSGSLPSE